MPIAIINQNLQAEVVFCEKAYHFTIRKAGTIEQGTSLEFSFGQRKGRWCAPGSHGFISHIADHSSSSDFWTKSRYIVHAAAGQIRSPWRQKKGKSILVVDNKKGFVSHRGSGVLDGWAEAAGWGQEAAHTSLSFWNQKLPGNLGHAILTAGGGAERPSQTTQARSSPLLNILLHFHRPKRTTRPRPKSVGQEGARPLQAEQSSEAEGAAGQLQGGYISPALLLSLPIPTGKWQANRDCCLPVEWPQCRQWNFYTGGTERRNLPRRGGSGGGSHTGTRLLAGRV